MSAVTLEAVQITCRVCEQTATRPLSASGLLCDACRADPDAAAQYITQALAAAEQQLVVAVDAWDACFDRASALDQAKFDVIRLTAPDMSPAVFERKRQATLAQNSGLGALFRAKERCDAAADEVQRVRSWAERTMAEVQELFDDNAR